MKHKVTWLLALLVSMPLALLPSTARASSIYDDAYVPTDTLWLGESSYYGVNCSYVDVRYTLEELLDDSANWQSSTDYTNYWPLFEEAKDEGSWAFSQYRHQAGGGESRQIWVTYSETPGELTWPNEHIVRASATEVITLLVMTRQVYFGYGGCDPFVVAYTGTEQDISRSTAYSPQFTENFVAVGWDYDYPVDYDGELIRETPPTPPTTGYGGTIDCGDTSSPVVSMTIAQPGNNGAAALTYPNPSHLYTAEWSYDLREDVEYSFVVVCGTKTAAPEATVDATAVSNDWICDVVASPPNYCMLF